MMVKITMSDIKLFYSTARQCEIHSEDDKRNMS